MLKKFSSKQPLVSIVMPCYNREALIGYSLDSLLAQKYSNWECIIVDDGSVDNTISKVKDYCKKDERFILFNRSRKPKGASTCRNIGMSKAQGEFVVFLDSDDILFDFSLYTRVQFLLEHCDLDFCVSDGVRGRYPIDSSDEYKLISSKKEKCVFHDFFSFRPPWVNLNPTYRFKYLAENKIEWDESLECYQDIDFHLKVLSFNPSFGYCLSPPDCLWTVHDNGNIGQKLKDSELKFLQKLRIVRNNELLIRKFPSDATPLFEYLIKIYLSQNLPVSTTSKGLDEYIRICCRPLIIKKLYQKYKFMMQMKVRILPVLLRSILMITKERDLLLYSKPKTSFCTISVPVINTLTIEDEEGLKN